MDRRSAFVAGAAGVMALILIMVLVYVYKNMPADAPERAVASIATNISDTMLLPPPVIATTSKTIAVHTRPVAHATNTRAVIAIQRPKPTVIKFSSLEDNFTGTWAAYPQLCDSAWYRIGNKNISVAGQGSCTLNHMMSANTTTTTSATLVLDCRHNNYASRETWNISQPRPGALNIRQNGGNAVTLTSCDITLAQK